MSFAADALLARRAVSTRTARTGRPCQRARMSAYDLTIATPFGDIGPEPITAASEAGALDMARQRALAVMAGAGAHVVVSQSWRIELTDATGRTVASVAVWADAAGRVHERDGSKPA
jgi:hypothetical protein